MFLIKGIRLSPIVVSWYSTRGGTSGYTILFTSPSASNVRSVTASILCGISGMLFPIALKRSTLCRLSWTITSIDHLSPNLFRISLIGQASSGFIVSCLLSVLQDRTKIWIEDDRLEPPPKKEGSPSQSRLCCPIRGRNWTHFQRLTLILAYDCRFC